MAEILCIDRHQPQPDRLARVRQVLAGGGLVIVPTETVYGIACDPQVPGAMQRLAAAKGRDGGKPVARLAAGVDQVRAEAVDWGCRVEALATACWPGPLTLVLKTADGWTGYRVPDHAVALALAAACEHPLALTSANLSGQPDTRTAQEAMAAVAADLVIDSGPSAEAAVPSTVAKIDGDRIICLREGRIPFTEVKTFFEGPIPSRGRA